MQQNRGGRGQRGSGGGRPWARGGRGDSSARARGRGDASGSWRPRGRGAGAGPTRMDHIASVSRSSGLEADGDTLKDWKVQEEYRVYLKRKVDELFEKKDRKKDDEANLLILFRKLREGIYASNRKDDFALEVYEMSLYLSTLFSSPLQTTSIISHLLPTHHTNPITTLLALLHHLIEGYPSQKTYYQLLSSIPQDSDHVRWIMDAAGSLRRGNYAKFERLTSKEVIDELTLEVQLASLSLSSVPNLPLQSLYYLVSLLRSKARQSAWSIIRSAYREFTILPSTTTQAWLERCLDLHGEMSGEEWLEKQIDKAATKRKEGEGMQGKWIIYKVR